MKQNSVLPDLPWNNIVVESRMISWYRRNERLWLPLFNQFFLFLKGTEEKYQKFNIFFTATTMVGWANDFSFTTNQPHSHMTPEMHYHPSISHKGFLHCWNWVESEMERKKTWSDLTIKWPQPVDPIWRLGQVLWGPIWLCRRWGKRAAWPIPAVRGKGHGPAPTQPHGKEGPWPSPNWVPRGRGHGLAPTWVGGKGAREGPTPNQLCRRSGYVPALGEEGGVAHPNLARWEARGHGLDPQVDGEKATWAGPELTEQREGSVAWPRFSHIGGGLWPSCKSPWRTWELGSRKGRASSISCHCSFAINFPTMGSQIPKLHRPHLVLGLVAEYPCIGALWKVTQI